jgi:hypothetical protein
MKHMTSIDGTACLPQAAVIPPQRPAAIEFLPFAAPEAEGSPSVDGKTALASPGTIPHHRADNPGPRAANALRPRFALSGQVVNHSRNELPWHCQPW